MQCLQMKGVHKLSHFKLCHRFQTSAHEHLCFIKHSAPLSFSTSIHPHPLCPSNPSLPPSLSLFLLLILSLSIRRAKCPRTHSWSGGHDFEIGAGLRVVCIPLASGEWVRGTGLINGQDCAVLSLVPEGEVPGLRPPSLPASVPLPACPGKLSGDD